MASWARLTPFVVGQIKAHMHHKLCAAEISRIVKKEDGTHPSVHGVSDAMQKLTDNPRWAGTRCAGSGRPRVTSKALDRKITRTVFKKRGSEKVTVAYLKKVIPAARKISDSTIQDRLHDAGLEWLRRRRKFLVPSKYIPARLEFAGQVKRARQCILDKWAYSDGTVFYLDKTPEANESTQQAALGSHVWRRADRKDALWADCIGPSGYNKAQGEPVRVWGVLAAGYLSVTVLPAGQTMNRWWYAWIVRHYFPGWLNGCSLLVQDFERCLRCLEPLEAMKEINLKLVENYPRCSQDLNAIENAWKILRDRLFETLPESRESREDFIARLRNAISWVNRNKYDELLFLCTNQKQRAQDVQDLKGSRTKW
eukprot:8025966-Karenia_brevis.AAC.1